MPDHPSHWEDFRENVKQSKRLSIYVAERLVEPEIDGEKPWYHTFLILVDDTRTPGRVLQQLHYNNDPDKQSIPNVRIGVAHLADGTERFKDLMASRVQTGPSLEILERWNQALAYTVLATSRDIRFGENFTHDPKALNCRAMVKTTLAHIGVEHNPEFYAQEAGLQAETSIVSDFNTTSRLDRPLGELIASNKSLSAAIDSMTMSLRERLLQRFGHAVYDPSRSIVDLPEPFRPMRRMDDPVP